ncbi:hypothetical protein [Novosphingobium sp. 9U]|uniref:hypothetical protein n=1 Tax=Novosphingobium sp. 9U TaxID=2653158 RepID=UPI0019166488|nr:hypothetical protein [Novosphingobium sp. 9U]
MAGGKGRQKPIATPMQRSDERWLTKASRRSSTEAKRKRARRYTSTTAAIGCVRCLPKELRTLGNYRTITDAAMATAAHDLAELGELGALRK